jgi:hypothetical protein
LVVVGLAVLLGACASSGRFFHQDGGPRDGAADIDAWTPPGIDGGPGHDAYVQPGTDAWVGPRPDAWVPPGTDGGPTPGTRAYLDRCTAAADCASGLCAPDHGGTHFCTRSCTSGLDCAHGHVCAPSSGGNVCMPSDTGAPCSVGMPERCVMGMCLGSAGGGHCTRPCSSAADCPAGYACTMAGGSTTPICVDIEQPCTAAADCGTGLCIPGIGCTATCRTAADCPGRLAGLPAYTCGTIGTTSNVCVPPSDIAGSSPIGGNCGSTPTGGNTCRSDACDTSAPLGPMCTQSCTALGGCAPGLGCYPLIDGADLLLVCERAGTGDFGAACSTGRDCYSGLCDGTGAFCTRLCADGLCPTGYLCQPVPGFGVSLCRR